MKIYRLDKKACIKYKTERVINFELKYKWYNNFKSKITEKQNFV